MDGIRVSGNVQLPSTHVERTRQDFRVPDPSRTHPPSTHPSLAPNRPSFLPPGVPDSGRLKLSAEALQGIFSNCGPEIVKMAKDVKWQSATSTAGKLLHNVAKIKALGMRDDRHKMKDFIEHVANTGIKMPNVDNPALVDCWHCIDGQELSLTIGFDAKGKIASAQPGVKPQSPESAATSSDVTESADMPDIPTRATAFVADAEIRRGNRRQSIVETAGDSEAMLYDFVRTFGEGIVDSVVAQLKDDAKTHPCFAPQIGTALNDKERVTSYLTEICKVGACAEFSRMAHYYCVEHTKGTWSHLVAVELPDPHNRNDVLEHVICVLYDKEITDTSRCDPEKAIVIDPWFKYTISTLSQFMQGSNPYHEKLGNENMLVDSPRRCEGKPILSAYVKDVIWRKTNEIHARETENLRLQMRKYSDPNQHRKGIYDFSRPNRNVNDLRNAHPPSLQEEH